jgi:hypothetical protein
MRNLEKEIAYLKDVLKMKRNGVQLQSENNKLKEMINHDLIQKLIK